MAKISLLDCTLRDGGYINDWNFGRHTIRNIIGKLVESEVDYIEVGFFRDCEYDEDKTLFNSCAEISRILPDNRGKTKFIAMALHNRYDVEKLEPYDGKTVEMIRVTFHDYDIDEGLEFVCKVKSKGYKVAVNPINIMGYTDLMILELIQKVNRIKPYAFSIVDTFGSMMKEDLQRIYSIVEHNLDKEIVIGLHLHENLALSYSLAQDFIAMKASGRKCIIDASMLGMGRAPGNLCMELIMDYMNKKQECFYNTNPVLDGIDDYIVALKQIEPWGYNTAYAISAKYNLHRNYAEYLLDKGQLRAKQINQILASVEETKKTSYDKGYIEKLYQDFQSNEIDDSKVLFKLQKLVAEREVIVLAPGSSIIVEEKKIQQYISEKKPIVFSANFVPEGMPSDYVFCSNAMRLEMIQNSSKDVKCIVTSNLVEMCKGEEEVCNYSELSFGENGICDNSVIMLIRLLKNIGVKHLAIAGFDGYREKGNDYVRDYMKSQHTKGEKENQRIKGYIKQLEGKIELQFITDSLYR